MLHLVCVVFCTECKNVEFPGCRKCCSLLGERLGDGQGRCNNCPRVRTDSWWKTCRLCNKAPNEVQWWCICDDEVAYAKKCMMPLPNDSVVDSFVLHCCECNVSEFPGALGQLIENREGLPYSVVQNRQLSGNDWMLFHRSSMCQTID